MPAKKKPIGYCPPTVVKGGVQINLNTVVTTVLGAVLIWLITTALNNQKTNSKTLDKIEVTLPFIQTTVGEVRKEVADVKSVMITRTEMNSKLERQEKAIDEVKNEQKRVSDDLRK